MGSKADHDDHTNPSISSQENNDIATSSSSLSNVTIRQQLQEPLLRPLLVEHQDRKTLVLDLDETLIRSSFVPIPHYDFLIEYPADTDDDGGVAYFLKRPGVDEFLEAAAELFEVVVFTAGSRTYANPVLDRLDVNGRLITHRLFYPQITRVDFLSRDGREETANAKDLSRLGRELSKTIIVDNSPLAYILQPENAVPISSYVEYQPGDGELSRVMSILRNLVDRNDDVREVLRQLHDQKVSRVNKPNSIV